LNECEPAAAFHSDKELQLTLQQPYLDHLQSEPPQRPRWVARLRRLIVAGRRLTRDAVPLQATVQ
jgi:hypothetical protein